ncbi:Gfo/Idh/MocA family protein [Candidatus Omnitrophota bacterium]
MKKINQPIRLGLIGCGKVAVNWHLPALASLQGIKVIAAADTDQKRLELVRDKFRIKTIFLDYRELLSDKSIEAVAVCVPTHLHCEVGLTVLEGGKHLFLEKPLAVSLDEADRLIKQAARTDKKVMLGFNKRWHRLVRRAKQAIQQNRLGPVSLINAVYSTGHYKRHVPEWRRHRQQGGGTLIEIGSHIFDMWHFLLQDNIDEVYAFSGSKNKSDDEPVIVSARSSGGMLLNCVLSDFLPEKNKLEIFGQDYCLSISLHRFEAFELMPLHSCDGQISNRIRGMGRFLKELPQGILQARYGGDYNASFRSQWQHFIDCIRHDRKIESTLEDGQRALRIALAAIESISTGKKIRVSEAPRKIRVPAT